MRGVQHKNIKHNRANPVASTPGVTKDGSYLRDFDDVANLWYLELVWCELGVAILFFITQ